MTYDYHGHRLQPTRANAELLLTYALGEHAAHNSRPASLTREEWEDLREAILRRVAAEGLNSYEGETAAKQALHRHLYS